MPALLAALIALALTMPAEGRHKVRTGCVQIWDEGVGPMRFCPPIRPRKTRQ